MIAAAQSRPWLYVEQILCHLDQEALDRAALSQAFSALLVQQPVLSTTFDLDAASGPRQGVGLGTGVPLEVIDWTQLAPDAQAEALEDFLSSDRERGCDLSGSPCFRLTLIRTGAQSCKLVWTFPHALLDGRSFAPLLEQAFENYALIRAGEVPDTGRTATSDVFWLHCKLLEQMRHEEGIAYFGRVLEGWNGSNDILDPQAPPARKKTATRRLTAAATQGLSALARRVDVTDGTLVAAAWGMVLARFSGRSDAVFGTTRNGRHLVDQAGTAPGCFIVTTPLRVSLTRDMKLGTLLKRVRADQLDLRPHEQTPLGQLRQVTNVPLGQPLLSSVLMFETGTLNDQMQARGGAWAHRRVDLYEEDDVPLTLGAYLGDGLEIAAEYDPSQVPGAVQLLDYLDRLLNAIARATPETPLAALDMLGQNERTLLEKLSGAEAALPLPETCCVTAFETVAARAADDLALREVGGPDITFARLDGAANHLSQELKARGIRCGDRVGICMQRGPLFVLSMLAIWKAGAAFVPMDPKYPQGVLEIMAEDSQSRLILTDDTVVAVGGPVMRLGADALRARASRDPEQDTLPKDRLAYVLFTSGTTGRPKGVMVSHVSLAAHAEAVSDLFDLAPTDRVLQFASLSFDVAIEEIVPTLLAGACLVLRSEDMSLSTSIFLAACAAERISLLNLPTGFWVELVRSMEETGRALPASLRLMVVGGERVPMSVLRRWRQLEPELRWINGYGPTETTITSIAHALAEADLDMTSVPIGKPLGHAIARVHAADGSLAPHGAEGELHISGLAVADGYAKADRSDRTPFSQSAQADRQGRSYRTGDRVSWQEDALQFIGRMDRQAKVRGYRVDPGQIECVLEERPEISRAYVAVPTSGPMAGKLVAWYSLIDPAQSGSTGRIDEILGTRLPAHLQPVLVEITDWPKTAGGKIDVAALPLPEKAALQKDEMPSDGSPQTRLLISLFKEILDTEAVNASTSFFDAGGDSLAALRLLTLIERKTGQSLSPAQVYENVSPARLGQVLRDGQAETSNVVPFQPEGTGMPIYALHALGENYSFFEPLSRALGKKHPFFGISIGLRAADFPRSIEELGRYYVDQITRHQPEGAIALVAVSTSSMIALEVGQQLLRAGRDVRGPFFFDSAGPDGRTRKSRMACRWVHLRKTMRHGWPYVAGVLRERRFEREHRRVLSDIEQEGHEFSEAARVNLTPAEFVAATELAIAAYTPQPYPRRLTIFRADDPFDDMSVYQNGLGWSGIASAGFDLIDVNGGHIDMLHPPHVAGLAERLSRCLARDGP